MKYSVELGDGVYENDQGDSPGYVLRSPGPQDARVEWSGGICEGIARLPYMLTFIKAMNQGHARG